MSDSDFSIAADYPTKFIGLMVSRVFLPLVIVAGTCHATFAEISFRIVALSEQIAPGVTGSNVFRSSEAPSISDSGLVAFRAFQSTAVYAERAGGGLRLVAAKNDPVPDVPGQEFFRFADEWIGEGGKVTVQGSFGINTSNESGLWSEVDGSGLRLVARPVTQIPGVGQYFGGFKFSVANDAHQIAFEGALESPSALGINHMVVTRFSNGAFSQTASQDLSGPGMELDEKYSGFGGVTLNGLGQVAFTASTYTSASFLKHTGLWRQNDVGGLELVALSRQPAPFQGIDTTLDSITGIPGINAHGETVFRSSLAGPTIVSGNRQSLWFAHDDGSLELVARQSEHAPGTSAGTTWGSVFGVPQLNDAGELAFLAFLSGTGANSTNDTGIWVALAGQQPRLLLRAGDMFEISPGDIRTISPLASLGRDQTSLNNRSFTMNSRGDLAISLNFTDGSSGVFAINAFSVPEPDSLLVALISLFGALLLRCDRRVDDIKRRCDANSSWMNWCSFCLLHRG